MGAYILRRVLLIVPTIFGVMVINFALVQFAPGGPIEQIMAQLGRLAPIGGILQKLVKGPSQRSRVHLGRTQPYARSFFFHHFHSKFYLTPQF